MPRGGSAALVAALPYASKIIPRFVNGKETSARNAGRWWMHYWYDERSAGGLEQKEEMPPSCLPCLRRSCYVDLSYPSRFPYVSAWVHYVPTRSYSHVPIPVNSYERVLLQGGSNRRLLRDVLARAGWDGVEWDDRAMVDRLAKVGVAIPLAMRVTWAANHCSPITDDKSAMNYKFMYSIVRRGNEGGDG